MLLSNVTKAETRLERGKQAQREIVHICICLCFCVWGL